MYDLTFCEKEDAIDTKNLQLTEIFNLKTTIYN